MARYELLYQSKTQSTRRRSSRRKSTRNPGKIYYRLWTSNLPNTRALSSKRKVERRGKQFVIWFQFRNRFTTGVVNSGTQLTGLNSVVNDTKNNWSWRVFRIPPGPNQTPQPVVALDKGLGSNVQNGDKIIFRFGRAWNSLDHFALPWLLCFSWNGGEQNISGSWTKITSIKNINYLDTCEQINNFMKTEFWLRGRELTREQWRGVIVSFQLLLSPWCQCNPDFSMLNLLALRLKRLWEQPLGRAELPAL